MKIIIAIAVSDIHRTTTRPICRVEEDHLYTQDSKLKYVRDLAYLHNVPLLCGGDVYETWKCGHDIVTSTRRILKNAYFISCYGQHELPSHDIAQKDRSPLSSHFVDSQLTDDGTIDGLGIYTCSWGERVKDIKLNVKKQGDIPKILLIHKMVYLDYAPFPGAKGNVRKLIVRPEYAQFDLIISGDNHMSFTYRSETTLWVNCGCLYRTQSNEKDYEPCCWVISLDPESNEISAERHVVPFTHEDVTEEHLQDDRQEKEWISEFTQALTRIKPTQISGYVKSVQKVCEEEPKRIRNKVNTFLGV